MISSHQDRLSHDNKLDELSIRSRMALVVQKSGKHSHSIPPQSVRVRNPGAEGRSILVEAECLTVGDLSAAYLSGLVANMVGFT